MKRFCLILSVLFFLLSKIYATDPTTESDHLIITHPQLEEGTWLQDLVTLQEERGFQVGVQYVEDGITTSDDIKSWIYSADTTGISVEYVLLAGAGADYIPDPITDPPSEESKIDLRYTPNIVALADSMNFIPFCYDMDVEVWGPQIINIPTDDFYIGLPDAPIDAAIGRIPAVNHIELQTFVDKLTETYAALTSYSEWKNREIMVSQNVTEINSGCIGQKVDWMYDEILVYVPADVDTFFLRSSELDPQCAWHYMCGGNSEILESAFETAINDGAGLVHYFGTGASPFNLGNFYWASDHDPYGSDFNFTNSGKSPFFMAVSCNLGKTQEPFTTPSIMKDLMFVDGGGILGAFAPTILTTQWACREFSEDFHRLLNDEGVNVIGDLTKVTKEAFEPRMPSRVWVSRGFVLYGDPSMPLSLYQYKDSDIAENTTWQGSIVVKSPITVEEGNTLTIKPGTGIFFEEDAKLTVNGNIVIEGSESFPIVFTSASEEPQSAGYWKGIIIDNPSSEVSIQHAVFKDAVTGLIISGTSQGGEITNCTFENNKTGLNIINSPSSLLVRDNIIKDNTDFGMFLTTSSPVVLDNNIHNNSLMGVVCIFSSNPVMRRNNIYSNGSSNIWLHTGLFTAGSDPKLFVSFNPEIPNCQTNNRFYSNSGSNVAAYFTSQPNFGVYNQPRFIPDEPYLIYGGFNRFYDSPYSIYNSLCSGNTIFAQVNYWNFQGDPCELFEPNNLYGDVVWDPPAPISGFGTDPVQSQIMRGLKKEQQEDYTGAIAVYDSVITEYPDDEGVLAAVRGRVRCHEADDHDEEIIPWLESILNQYSGTLTEVYAKDNIIPYLTKQGSFDPALDYCSTLQSYFENTEYEAFYIYEEGYILERMAESGLGRTNNQITAESRYREITENHPDSPMALLASIKLGEDLPTPTAETTPIPEKFALHQNYPNPFNPSTTIAYDLTNPAHVEMFIYDIMGREAASIENAIKNAGSHKIVWNADGFSNGVYFYHLTARSTTTSPDVVFTETRKLILLK